MTIDELGASVKAKYPEYKDQPDSLVGQKVLEKYPVYQSRITQPEAPKAAPNEQHPFLSSLAEPFKKTLAAIPAVVGATGKLITSGGKDTAGAMQELQKERSFGVFGTARPVTLNQQTGQSLTAGQGIKDIVGTGAEIGSYLAPVGVGEAAVGGATKGILPALTQGAKAGAAFGALGGSLGAGGRELAKPESTIGSVAKQGILGGLGGAAIGGVLPVIGNIGGKALGATAKAVEETAPKVGEFAVSQMSGLSPETIRTVEQGGFKEASKGVTRGSLGEEAQKAFDTRLNELSDLGSGYDAVRKDVTTLPVKRTVSGLPDFVVQTLKKYGVEVDNNGQIKALTASTKLQPGDAAALQKFLDQYAKAPAITGNEFLNTRQALDELAKWGRDPSKTAASADVAKALRSQYDSLGKSTYKGLKELDNQYAPERQFINEIKKDLFTKDGELKDNALTTLANLTKKGNEAKLARVEQLMPGIGEKVKILRAIEDIYGTQGPKVGTYTRSMLLGAGAIHNPVGAVLGLIALQPNNLVKIIETYGAAKGIGTKIIQDILNKIKVGKRLSAFDKKIVKDAIELASRNVPIQAGIKSKESPTP